MYTFFEGVHGMISYFSELRYKEVIDIHTGFRLGYICDVEDDYVLPWSCIVKVGSDIVLIEAKGEFMRRKRQHRLF